MIVVAIVIIIINIIVHCILFGTAASLGMNHHCTIKSAECVFSNIAYGSRNIDIFQAFAEQKAIYTDFFTSVRNNYTCKFCIKKCFVANFTKTVRECNVLKIRANAKCMRFNCFYTLGDNDCCDTFVIRKCIFTNSRNIIRKDNILCIAVIFD